MLTLLATVAMGALGGLGAWALWRRTDLTGRHFYLAAGLALALLALVGAAFPGALLPLANPLLALTTTGAVTAHRLRRSALGAGEELRNHEMARRWLWQPATAGSACTYIANQGELVRKRRWPAEVPSLELGRGSGRLPRGEGRHILVAGATGAGKTVTAARIAIGRLALDAQEGKHPALVCLDPKGDPYLAAQLRALAARFERPLVVFDPLDPRTDHWAALAGDEPAAVIAKAIAPLINTEPYYWDLARVQLLTVARALCEAGRWPLHLDSLVRAADPEALAAVRASCDGAGASEAALAALDRQIETQKTPRVRGDVAGTIQRLAVLSSGSARAMLGPRCPGEDAIALRDAIDAGAIVLYRTWADVLGDEAAQLTALAIADVIDATRGPLSREWMLVCDEFGAVLRGNAADLALRVLQRARGSGGQAVLLTQSLVDVEAIAENPALIEAMADNFAAVVVHRQSAPKSRDWAARLFGTRNIWQSTDRTFGGGIGGEGSGSRRRAREFLVPPDEYAVLGTGEAWMTTVYGAPERVQVGRIALDGALAPPGAEHLYRRITRSLGALDLGAEPPPSEQDPEAGLG